MKEDAIFAVSSPIPFLAVRVFEIYHNTGDKMIVDSKINGRFETSIPYNVTYKVEFYSVVTGNVMRTETCFLSYYGCNYNMLPDFFEKSVYLKEDRTYKISNVQ